MATLRKDGRLQSSVTIEDPITLKKDKIYIYGYSEEEIAEERRRVKGSATASLQATSFKFYSKEVLEYRVRDNKIAQGTYESYTDCLTKHAYDLIGAHHLDQINVPMLRNMFKQIRTSRMRQYVYTIVKSIFAQAKLDHIIKYNPCDSITKPQVETRETQVVDLDKYKDIVDHLPSIQMQYLVKTAWETGGRRGELAALRWSDMDMTGCLIDIKKTLKRVKANKTDATSKKVKKNKTIIGPTKSKAGVRMLPVTEAYMVEMQQWKDILKQMLADNGIPWDDNGFVFRSVKDLRAPMPLTTITNTFARISEKMKLPKGTTFHSMRHSQATMLVENDVNPKKLQIRMGHATAAFTMSRYVHNTAKMQEGITDILDKNR